MPYGYQIWLEEPLTRAKCNTGAKGLSGGHPGSTRDLYAKKCSTVTKFDQKTPGRVYFIGGIQGHM